MALDIKKSTYLFLLSWTAKIAQYTVGFAQLGNYQTV